MKKKNTKLSFSIGGEKYTIDERIVHWGSLFLVFLVFTPAYLVFGKTLMSQEKLMTITVFPSFIISAFFCFKKKPPKFNWVKTILKITILTVFFMAVFSSLFLLVNYIPLKKQLATEVYDIERIYLARGRKSADKMYCTINYHGDLVEIKSDKARGNLYNYEKIKLTTRKGLLGEDIMVNKEYIPKKFEDLNHSGF